MFLNDADIVRDFTNDKGTRYTRAVWGVARAKGSVWFALIDRKDHWMAGFMNVVTGCEIRFAIIQEAGVPRMNAIHAYKTAMDVYAAFLLNDENAKMNFAPTETRH